jgi:hypothetical protein
MILLYIFSIFKAQLVNTNDNHPFRLQNMAQFRKILLNFVVHPLL